jgi:hypothetical protein
MDIITQRFIAIGNRLLAELRKINVTLTQIQQQVKAVAGQPKPEKKEDSPPQEVIASVSFPASVETKRDTTEKNKQRRDRWRLFVEVLTLIAVVGYGLVAYHQWKTMNQTYSEIAKQTPKIAETARAATQANIDARDRFRQEERPYLWLSDLGHPDFLQRPEWKKEEGGYVVWDWHFTNYGKSPAYHVTFRQGMIAGEQVSAKNRTYSILIKGSPCPPTKDEWDTAFYKDKISHAKFEQLMDTEDAVIIYGKVYYDDSYGTTYETGFCLNHLRSGAISYCKEGNYIK